jgi:hypothetical protein
MGVKLFLEEKPLREGLKSVHAFLEMVRSCLQDEDSWDWLIRRPENTSFVSRHGLSRAEIRREVEKLSSGHRTQGPMDDDKVGRDAGTVFVFSKPFETETGLINLYIKIKIPDDEPFCIVVSFHEEGRVG